MSKREGVDLKTGEVRPYPYLDEYGREVLDPNPAAMPLGFKRPESLADTIRRLIRHEVSQAAQESGDETFEDADDFDVDDDPADPSTPYEMNFDQEAYPRKEFRTFQEEVPETVKNAKVTPAAAAAPTQAGGETPTPTAENKEHST